MSMKTWLEKQDAEYQMNKTMRNAFVAAPMRNDNPGRLSDDELRILAGLGRSDSTKFVNLIPPEFAATPPKADKYLREVKPGVMIDVYDVLQAWGVTNPALQHLIKKALQTGQRGHKSREEDLADIVASALRAKELG